ncbi:MAG: hypothetical protein ICV70_04795 [Jiangellaceae bacterium]|nr:hypothetical protein [Jiangellaceae bacterium]
MAELVEYAIQRAGEEPPPTGTPPVRYSMTSAPAAPMYRRRCSWYVV